jgi:hypothetical protein
MSQSKAKKRTKKNQGKAEALIRTDVWDLKATSVQKKLMQLTITEYRRFLFPLVIIINAHWTYLVTLTDSERVNWVEKAIHVTRENPNPKYRYYQKVVDKYPSLRKFPSYLRRAAIAEALGIVSSFQTRYREWQSGIRKHRKARPPSLTAICQSYPALYQGQQIKYNDNYQSVDLKVWNGSDWVWLTKISIKSYGLNRHLTVGNELKSPTLVVNSKTCQLSIPVKIKPVKKEESDYVCAVDLGINNAATCSIVGKDGKELFFICFPEW